MAESYRLYDRIHQITYTTNRITKKKRIGVVRPDNHGIIYAYCLGNGDRYDALDASLQLYILENKHEPIIPFRDTEIVGVYREQVLPSENWAPGAYERYAEDAKTTPLSAEQFAKAFRCPVYDTLEEMADPEKLDGVLIGNCGMYAEDHVELAMPFIKKGIPIFIDKPFAANAKDAAKILNAAREYNCPVFSSSILYYDDAHHNMVDKQLGKTKFVVSTYGTTMQQRNASVHCLSNLLGAVRYANGNDYKVESITFMGNGSNFKDRGWNGKSYGDDHNELYRVEFADGTIGILNMEGFGHYAFQVEAYCEKGISSEYTVEQSLRGGIVEIAWTFARMIDSHNPPIDYDRIFEFVATIDAGLRSREERRTVTLQEIADEAGWVFGTKDHKVGENEQTLIRGRA